MRIRVVAAGIEDDDVQVVLGRLHLRHHKPDINRFVLDLLFAVDRSAHRNQVVSIAHLHAVTGVVEQADSFAPAAAQALAERTNRLLHLRLRHILALKHIEAAFAQRLRHRPRIVDRILQRCRLIGRVADDERKSFGVWRRGRGRWRLSVAPALWPRRRDERREQQQRQHGQQAKTFLRLE